jgi:hypothetical protein
MKTSNKILLGLLVVIFTIPFLLAATLKSKINKGEYVVKKYENVPDGNMHTGSFTAFKVIKVVGPNPELLRCHLKLSDKMDYNYYSYKSDDSLQVFTSSDTLYVKYVGHDGKGQNDFEVNINLPSFTNLVVDGAVVIIDSLPSTLGNLNVILQNNGVIKDGSKGTEEETSRILSPAEIDTKNASQAATVTNDDVDRVGRSDIFKVVQNDGLQLLAVDIKDLLLSGLLYKL